MFAGKVTLLQNLGILPTARNLGLDQENQHQVSQSEEIIMLMYKVVIKYKYKNLPKYKNLRKYKYKYKWWQRRKPTPG